MTCKSGDLPGADLAGHASRKSVGCQSSFSKREPLVGGAGPHVTNQNLKNIFWIFALVPGALTAQTISGVVTDPQAKAVAGASVSMMAQDGDARRDTTSDATGGYRFEHVASGEYVIQAQAPGFSRFVAAHVRIAREQNLRLDLPLQIASAAQQVVVTASSTPQTADETSKCKCGSYFHSCPAYPICLRSAHFSFFIRSR